MMMKKALVTLLLLSSAAMADIRIKDFQVRRGNTPGLEEVNVRIVVNNPGSTVQPGPITVTLMGRRPGGEWANLQTWELGKLPAGYTVARDYFSSREHDFELRAVVTTPDGQTDERLYP